MTLAFSRRLAVVAGCVLPVTETARRWHQIGDVHVWPFWLDDWAIAIFLLYGVWSTRTRGIRGQAILSAAWGFACGMAYASFVSQLAAVDRPDPSGVPTTIVVAIKGMALVLAIVGLVAAVRPKAVDASYAADGISRE